ncbi:hypothetical protein [Caldicellulosiruptor sp. DIB 104C]|uniref:hypothetical protein n=1 Tax=Caldicellulosiruptor sp. DIB 104C TaxID=3019889 RepID=UPI003BB851C9
MVWQISDRSIGVFQSPKGRLQIKEFFEEAPEQKEFQSPKGRLQILCNLVVYHFIACFNPQRGGYKSVEELDFIISRLYTPVNVFISEHLWKAKINPEKSSDKSLLNLSVYPDAARSFVKSMCCKYETVYKSNLKILPPEVDRYDFWLKC